VLPKEPPMILRYWTLRRQPAIFKTMTGLTVALFDELVDDLAPAYAQATYAQRNRPGRQRAVGAGHPRCLALREQFLLTVIWLRHYFTQETLGYFFGVSDTTALRTIERVLPVLEQAGRDTMRQPPPSRRQRLGVAEVLRAFPEVADLDDDARVVDTYEQRVQRPQDRDEADRHYSGKKKAHTLKTQVVVELGSGQVREVTPGVRGPVSDGTVLQHSGALERLPSGVRGVGDKAYIGVGGGRVATPRRKPRGKPRPPEDVAFNRAFARVRISVEHTMRDLRIFQALTQPDRHRRRGQPARVCAVVGLRARRCRPGRRDRRQAA
jgi:DDE superfamily endonuclease/Helix-turn-helix of DDE superfamily endonuclease